MQLADDGGLPHALEHFAQQLPGCEDDEKRYEYVGSFFHTENPFAGRSTRSIFDRALPSLDGIGSSVAIRR